tara:strand:- start:358 stop:897 length:540 start_codon:yes stop_codon:yes gene_type:complete
MKIDNDLIVQWEPKIQKMLLNIFIVGMEKDDIAQELRIAIIKAAKSFDSSRGVIFHTYLHTTLVNTIRTLMSRVQKRPETRSLDAVYSNAYDSSANGNMLPAEILKALQDPIDYEAVVEMNSLLATSSLSDNEKMFIDLRIKGKTMEEITEDLGESSYKVRQNLRGKFGDLAKDYDLNL